MTAQRKLQSASTITSSARYLAEATETLPSSTAYPDMPGVRIIHSLKKSQYLRRAFLTTAAPSTAKPADSKARVEGSGMGAASFSTW